ncbi:hypothetical protein AK812_SmicGene23953 [Symbiodinium microadriaticum]|uniref:Uncharacterized protein n=1 Tax=Symbiodinium microadriaticum TaxID=2951 RepID=A0A1Q9DFZ2_SYMMI|nr:hypothetical protein AK812_SmicGene23953 [Symbiodinium microadriaticum]
MTTRASESSAWYEFVESDGGDLHQGDHLGVQACEADHQAEKIMMQVKCSYDKETKHVKFAPQFAGYEQHDAQAYRKVTVAAKSVELVDDAKPKGRRRRQGANTRVGPIREATPHNAVFADLGKHSGVLADGSECQWERGTLEAPRKGAGGSIVEYWTENGRDHIVRLCEKRSLHADRLSMSKSGILEPPEWLHIVCDVIAAVQWAAQFLKRSSWISFSKGSMTI